MSWFGTWFGALVDVTPAPEPTPIPEPIPTPIPQPGEPKYYDQVAVALDRLCEQFRGKVA